MDVVDQDRVRLQKEVLALRRGRDRLLALLRVFVLLWKVSGYSVSRSLDTADKDRLLAAIDRTRAVLPLRAVLRIIGLPTTRYHAPPQPVATAAAVFGVVRVGRPGDYTTHPTYGYVGSGPHIPRPGEESWLADEAVIRVQFDGTSKVVHASSSGNVSHQANGFQVLRWLAKRQWHRWFPE
jgi:hypothetical protein